MRARNIDAMRFPLIISRLPAYEDGRHDERALRLQFRPRVEIDYEIGASILMFTPSHISFRMEAAQFHAEYRAL